MFANVTWKQAVIDQVLAIVNQTGSMAFRTNDLYAYRPVFAALFPRNHHIDDKIRQTLQYLRDDGLVVFHDRGRYSLNVEHPTVEVETPPPVLPPGRARPALRTALTTMRLRDTVLGLTLKRLYRHKCQVCLKGVPLAGADYVESHHLRPLGRPHEGPDTPGNIIVVCPNHHVMFDRGAAAIQPPRLTLVHAKAKVFRPNQRLHVVSGHTLARFHIRYHYKNIFSPNLSAQ